MSKCSYSAIQPALRLYGVQAKPFVSLRVAYRLKATYKTMIVSSLKQKNHGKIQSKIWGGIANASKSDGGFVAIYQFYLRLLIRCQSSLNAKKSFTFLLKAG
ncbi:MAG: hypothetical protein Q8J88_11780 [Bacteroidales bacterium]|nr:hypothetical protein [Bacteroidales bacterium]